MCSTIAGCTNYDLGNTTIDECCGGSLGGLFYSSPGTQDCNSCESKFKCKCVTLL